MPQFRTYSKEHSFQKNQKGSIWLWGVSSWYEVSAVTSERVGSVADGGTIFKFQNLYYDVLKQILCSLKTNIFYACLFPQKILFYDLLLPVHWIQPLSLILQVFQNTKVMWEKHHLYVLPNRLALATHINFLDLLIKSSTLLQIWNSCQI